jgi:hypothetical protein
VALNALQYARAMDPSEETSNQQNRLNKDSDRSSRHKRDCKGRNKRDDSPSDRKESHWNEMKSDKPKDSRNSKPKKDSSHITCYNCNKKGHYANECPHPKVQTNAARVTSDTASEARSSSKNGSSVTEDSDDDSSEEESKDQGTKDLSTRRSTESSESEDSLYGK